MRDSDCQGEDGPGGNVYCFCVVAAGRLVFFVYILVGQVVYHDSFILWRLRLLSQINRRM